VNPQRLGEAVDTLERAWRERALIDGLPAELQPSDAVQAGAIQNLLVDRLGGHGGWKVGAADAAGDPGCAPLPRGCLLDNGAQIEAACFGFRGIEVEVGFVFGEDLPADPAACTLDRIARAIRAVRPTMEIVASRYTNWRSRNPLEQLADLGSHGVLVIGQPVIGVDPLSIDSTTLEAVLRCNGREVVRKRGGNTAGDIRRLLAWLGPHVAARGLPIRAGDIVTTGSCSGLYEGAAGDRFEGEPGSFGTVGLSLV
jgi:2-keto-4-pentenoate hydratase